MRHYLLVCCLLVGVLAVIPGCTSTTNTTTTTTATTTSTTSTTGGGGTHNLTNLFFLHHSVGDNLIVEGDVRGVITAYNTSHGTSFAFWDHGYQYHESYWGLRNAAGTLTGTDYGPLTDSTDPTGLEEIFTTDNTTRTQIMTNHQVIAFKSCFTATENLNDDGTLTGYQNSYLAMRTYFDAHPEKLFIVVTPPPVIISSGLTSNSNRARTFANWLKSTASGGFLNGSHPNIKCFDLFNYLANADDGSPTANMLKSAYETYDSHPNATANAYLGPIFAQFLINEALSY